MAYPPCRRRRNITLALGFCLAFAWPVAISRAMQQSAPAPGSTSQPASGPVASSMPGVPFTPEKLASLLPPSVYFQGRSAPLQLRNAGGTTFPDGQIVWVSLVDSSGYSSSIQEKYQFYLVTEGSLRVGGVSVPAGAYGGGFLQNGFLLMDLGGHTVAQGPVETDAELRRPRPLQLVAERPAAVKLYLGRRWVSLEQIGTDSGKQSK